MLTTNCLVKSNIIKVNNIFFDLKYGLTGGEDVMFLDVLSQIGAKYVNCKETMTYEIIQSDKTKDEIFLFRSLWIGISNVRRMLELNKIELQVIRIKIL